MWLRRGGVLVIFPAGEVAHEPARNGTPTDASWKPTAGRLALATGARVLPAFIDGGNSRLFRAVGHVHPLLRTLLLARELLALRGRTVSVRMGAPLRLDSPAGEDGAGQVTRRMRDAVEALDRKPAPGNPPDERVSMTAPADRPRRGTSVREHWTGVLSGVPHER